MKTHMEGSKILEQGPDMTIVCQESKKIQQAPGLDSSDSIKPKSATPTVLINTASSHIPIKTPQKPRRISSRLIVALGQC